MQPSFVSIGRCYLVLFVGLIINGRFVCYSQLLDVGVSACFIAALELQHYSCLVFVGVALLALWMLFFTNCFFDFPLEYVDIVYSILIHGMACFYSL